MRAGRSHSSKRNTRVSLEKFVPEPEILEASGFSPEVRRFESVYERLESLNARVDKIISSKHNRNSSAVSLKGSAASGLLHQQHAAREPSTHEPSHERSLHAPIDEDAIGESSPARKSVSFRGDPEAVSVGSKPQSQAAVASTSRGGSLNEPLLSAQNLTTTDDSPKGDSPMSRRSGSPSRRYERSKSADFKYAQAWDESQEVPQAVAFFGDEMVDTNLTDFDLVFVFPNPGHVEEYSDMLTASHHISDFGHMLAASRHSAGHHSRRRASVAEEYTVVEKRIAELRKLREDEEQEFLSNLVAREQKRHKGKGPKKMLRCTSCRQDLELGVEEPLTRRSTIKKKLDKVMHKQKVCVRCQSCNGRLEEVLKRCRQCARKLDYDVGMCTYCRSEDLVEKVHPVVSDVKDFDSNAVSSYTADLLEEFFVDPRQGVRLDIPLDLETLQDARRAVIDIFLSFFRAQDQDDYYTYLFKSIDLDEIFLCVKMGEKTAKNHADVEQYCLLIDKNQMVKPVEHGGMNIKYDNYIDYDFGSQVSRTFSLHTFGDAKDEWIPEVNPAFQGGPVEFDAGMERLLTQYEQESDDTQTSIFRKSDRIRLIYDKVTDVINVQELVDWGLLVAFYPMHTKEALVKLKNSWARVGLAYKYTQPMHLIHQYFGENIALYFVFLEHMLKYMWFLVIVSVVFTAIEIVAEARDHWSVTHKSLLRLLSGKAGIPQLRIAWCLLIIIWCQVLHIRLKRKVITKCNIWGVDGQAASTVKNEMNPRFGQYAEVTASDLNENELEVTVPWRQVTRGRIMSRIATILFVVFSTGCSMSVLWLQSWLYKNGIGWQQTLARYMSLALTITIKILNGLWCIVGQYLVDHEYWRERLDYDNAMAYKNFYVQFVTTFVSFYYIAFIMNKNGDDSYNQYGQWKDDNGKVHTSNDPWEYLTYMMVFTFGLYLVFSVYDLISPLLELWWSRRSERKKLAEVHEEAWEYSFIELQSKMTEYDGDLQNDDYMQILLPLGFVLFFGATLPISALCCWIYTSAQLRVDAWKLCHAMKRPYPRTTKPGAWVWEGIIDMFLKVSTITNIGLICFTMDPLQGKPLYQQLAVFFGLIFVVSLFNGILQEIYPSVSHLVELARRRHDYQREVAFRMFHTHPPKQFMQLRASKGIGFDATVARLRRSSYKSSRLTTININRRKVDRVFQSQLPLTFWGKMENPERPASFFKHDEE